MQSSRAVLVVVLADGSTFAEVPVMLTPSSEVAQQTAANTTVGS